MTWCAIVMHVICSLSRQSRESLSDRHFVFIYTNICKYMCMLEEAKPKKHAWHLESFTVVPLFGGKKRGTQTTTSQHPPHLLCSPLPPNVDRSMEGTQSPPSEGPPSRFFHLLNPSRVITQGLPSIQVNIPALLRDKFTHWQVGSQNSVFNVIYISK